jgi:PAS domain S-box-containing protein
MQLDHHKSLSNWKIRLAFGAAILALLIVGAISYRTMAVSRDSERWVRHTHEVLENLQDLLIASESIESSYRGFVLTGEQSHFESYRANILSLERHEAAVRSLTVDNLTQQRRISDLERLTAQEIQFVETVVALRRAQGFEAATDAIRTRQDQRVKGEFHEKIRELQQEELRLLALRDADSKGLFDDTRAVLIFGTVFGLLIAAAAAWSVQRDGSRRGFAEKALLQSEEKYRGLLEAAPDAMVVVNQAGAIVLVNVQAEKQFGYRRDELVGQKVMNIIPEGFAERLIADATRSTAEALAQQIGMGIELSGRRKDGTEFPIEIMLSPLESTEGILVTAAIRNISARKKSEQELAVANQVLEESNLELKQFAYIASHDLQTPLRSIAGFVQLLQQEYEGKLDEQAQVWILRTVLAVTRMQTLIGDLLSYSRVEARSGPFTQIPFLDIVNDALILLESSIHDSGGQVACGRLPIVMGDRSQLVQLMQNLIGNGLTYRSDKPPHIQISAKRSGKDWIFSISDNGIGIDPKHFEQIFEIFKRLHNQKDKPGTGIGLAVCRRVVNRHGGKIWVESEPGHGSTFHFTIPEGTEQTNEQSTR